MRKNSKRIIVFLLMIVMVASLFIACKDKEDDPPPVDGPTQNELFVDMLQDVVGAFGADFEKNLKVDLSLDASYKNGEENYVYGIDIKGNVNKLEAENNDLYIRLVDKSKTETKSILGLYYYKDNLYMEVGDKVYGINSFDMKNIAPLLKISGITVDDSLSENAILTAVIGLLAGENGITKDEAGNYKMAIDISGLADSLQGLESVIDEVITNNGEPILTIPGIGPITATNLIKWLKENPTSINIDVSPKENSVGLKLDIKHNDIVIAANGSNLSIANGNFSESEMPILTAFAEKSINDETIFVNLGNISAEGTIDLLGKDNASYMTMNWKLVSDIDPFEFFEAAEWAKDTNNPYGWIEAAILNDNKFHFQVAHKCNGVCDAEGGICTTKSPKATNILDIAFDPTTFGNDYIYLSVNVASIFSSDQFSGLLSALGIDLGMFAGTVKGMLTENQIIPINVKTLLEPYQTEMPGTSEPGTPPIDPEPAPEIDIKNILKIVNSVIQFLTDDGITLDKESGLTLNITDLLSLIEDAAGLEQLVKDAGMDYNVIKDIILSVFSGNNENNQIHKFNVKVTKFVFGTNALADYSCKDEVLIFKPLTDHTEERVYAKDKGGLVGESVELKDTVKTIIGGENVLDPSKPISPQELKYLVGGYIKYNFQSAKETTIVNNTTSVVGFKNVKWDLYNVEQEITVVLGLLDSAGVLSSIQGLGGILYNLTGAAIALPLPTFEAKLKITFTEFDKSEVTIKERLNEVNPILAASTQVTLGAFAKVTYKDGQTKTINLPEPSSTNFFKEKKSYFMTSEGTFFHEYEYAGDKDRQENIKYLKPDNIVTNFGTKDAPYAVKLGTEKFINGMPTFHSNEILFEYDKAGLPNAYQVVPPTYFYDEMVIKDVDGKEVKDVIKDGKFDKVGKYEFTFNFRGVEMSGWFEVKDTVDSKVMITQKSSKIETKIFSVGDNNVDLTIGYKYEGVGVKEGDIILKVSGTDLSEYTSTLNTQSETALSATITTTFNSLLAKGEYFVKITAYDKATNKDLSTLYFSVKKTADGAGDVVAGTKTFTTADNFAGALKLKVTENGVLVDKLLAFDNDGYYFQVGDKRVDVEMYILNSSTGIYQHNAEGKFEPFASSSLCVRITTPGYEKYVKISGYKVTQA